MQETGEGFYWQGPEVSTVHLHLICIVSTTKTLGKAAVTSFLLIFWPALGWEFWFSWFCNWGWRFGCWLMNFFFCQMVGEGYKVLCYGRTGGQEAQISKHRHWSASDGHSGWGLVVVLSPWLAHISIPCCSVHYLSWANKGQWLCMIQIVSPVLLSPPAWLWK